MRMFTEPEMNVVVFSVEDVITTSIVPGGGNTPSHGGMGGEE